MRKQYHFRPGPAGLRAWDVDRLIALSRDFIPREVPLTEIRELDEPFWSTADDCPPTCRDIIAHARLMEQADLRYPVILSADGRLMDGMHRVAKALLTNQATIRAVQFQLDPEPDFEGIKPEALPY